MNVLIKNTICKHHGPVEKIFETYFLKTSKIKYLKKPEKKSKLPDIGEELLVKIIKRCIHINENLKKLDSSCVCFLLYSFYGVWYNREDIMSIELKKVDCWHEECLKNYSFEENDGRRKYCMKYKIVNVFELASHYSIIMWDEDSPEFEKKTKYEENQYDVPICFKEDEEEEIVIHKFLKLQKLFNLRDNNSEDFSSCSKFKEFLNIEYNLISFASMTKTKFLKKYIKKSDDSDENSSNENLSDFEFNENSSNFDSNDESSLGSEYDSLRFDSVHEHSSDFEFEEDFLKFEFDEDSCSLLKCISDEENIDFWDYYTKETFDFTFDVDACFENCPKQMIKLIKHLETLSCDNPKFEKYLESDVLKWDDEKMKNLISKKVHKILQVGGDFSAIIKCYDENCNQTIQIINKIWELNCYELGCYLNTSTLYWNEDKLKNLFSPNVCKIIQFGGDFDKIVQCFDENRDQTIQEINDLNDIKKRILDWDIPKLKFLFSENVKKIIDFGGNPFKIQECYNKNSSKIIELIERLQIENSLELAKNIDIYNFEENYLFSKEIHEIVQNGCDFKFVYRSFINHFLWTQKNIEHLKKNNCLGLGKYLFHNISFALQWSDEKIESLFTEKIWNIVSRNANFYEIVRCYEIKPIKTLNLIECLHNINCLNLGKYITTSVLYWSRKKKEFLFSKKISNLIKEGNKFYELVQNYDERYNKIIFK